ncbi:heme A synthase [Viridibacillus sp. FSL R5-0477]|uniref:Heme A synthase n=1 Tax=Viridibacillus arenosi FSL R5-213 TaxID=1227360 RepID=W4F084_9BACL|nr:MULTISPECIES: heme A synthase [Viridibacillus]ETT85727.1 cytochrome aa3-controlling protein [Viridibacillus arenosi FSL R5-213]OMC83015.1 heme A synthase [Viridibacillus sp. FSL H8-0123]OMC88933.1 heme A synthase [Viridibacillus sp. FSL H7-0596]OMC93562.1 heme A synthase [Viridibacillus arenosi]
MQYSKYMKWFAVAATIGMLLILLGGALVTKTDSGMGCGRNWPDCNGSLIPKEITTEVLIEFSHRVVTGAVSFLILILTVWAWRVLGHIREVKFLSFMALFFLIAQALIGAAQVLWGQGDFILALHFGISLLSFAAVLLLTLIIFEVDQKFDADKVIIGNTLKRHTIGVTIYSYLVVYTGALVRHTNASLICPDWPLCNNNNIGLPTNFYEWVQMGHRFAAGLIFVWILFIAIHAIKHYKEQRVLYWGWIIALIIVSLQVLAGMAVVLSRLNILLALLHSLLITLLFGLLCYMILLLSRSRQNQKSN